MTVRVGINGFGRIGRTFLRAALKNGADVEVVAVNDITDVATLATLLEWDSVSGHLEGVRVEDDAIVVGENRLRVFAQRDPSLIPWGEVGAPDGGRERIGGVIGPWRLRQSQDRGDHPAHLVLGGAAMTRHRQLDGAGRRLGDLDAGLRHREQHHPARLADSERGLRVPGKEQPLHADDVRLVQREQVGDRAMDRLQPDRERVVGAGRVAAEVDGPQA